MSATANRASNSDRKSSLKHIWVITGPAGCGKTSVAEFLHSTYGMPYLEGDTFHTPENVQKMADGQPLADADRWDWLIVLRDQALATLADSRCVVVTCSALKRKYRDVIRVASYHQPEVRVHFIFLSVSDSILMDRVRARRNHYMKDYMVRSQLESLEAPQTGEIDVLSIDAGGTSQEVQQLVLNVVDKLLNEKATSSTGAGSGSKWPDNVTVGLFLVVQTVLILWVYRQYSGGKN